MDFLQEHPFVFGLLVGLAVVFYTWVRGVMRARALEAEMRRLKDLLHTKLELEARSHKALHDELEDLRKHNENLRVSLKTLQQKPDRHELRLLHVYDQAIRTLLSRSPGFGPAWQTVLEEAEREMEANERGLGAFVRRVFSPRASIKALPDHTLERDDSSDDA